MKKVRRIFRDGLESAKLESDTGTIFIGTTKEGIYIRHRKSGGGGHSDYIHPHMKLIFLEALIKWPYESKKLGKSFLWVPTENPSVSITIDVDFTLRLITFRIYKSRRRRDSEAVCNLDDLKAHREKLMFRYFQLKPKWNPFVCPYTYKKTIQEADISFIKWAKKLGGNKVPQFDNIQEIADDIFKRIMVENGKEDKISN